MRKFHIPAVSCLCLAIAVALPCGPADAAVRATLGALPPWGYAAGAEVSAGPVLARAGAVSFLNTGGIALTLALPLAHVWGLSFGPLAGVSESWMPAACPTMPGIPCNPYASAPGPIGVTLGLSANWTNGPWWVTARPTVNIIPRPMIPPIPGSGGAPIFQAPFFDLILPVIGCPPVLEVGYKLSPHLGVSLRACTVPFAASYDF